MSLTLKPYPEYKDSGVPWLGDVPEHWDVRPVKRVAKLNPSKSEAASILKEDAEVTFLPMERVTADGRINAREIRRASAVWNGFTYFRRSDVLIAKITPCFENGKGACLDSLPTEAGFGSTEFIVLRSKGALLPQYLYRTTTLAEFRRLGADAMNGAAGQQRVPSAFVGNFQTTVPSIPEQSAIARFLDGIDSRIQRYIRAKKRVIELLEEQKQAIIQRAVTRGLDPNVRLKPSGVEWLGNVPEHWEIKQISRFAQVGNGSTPSRSKPSYWQHGSYPWLNSSQVNRGLIDSADQFVTPLALQECHLPRVPRGSVLIAITGQGKTRGTAAVLGIEATINQHIAFIRPRSPIVLSEFLHLALAGAYQALRAISDDSGSTKGALTCESLKHFKLALPPQPEQVKIVDEIRATISNLDAAISRTEREISLILEYRTRLIADVVTGKLDVRGVELPAVEEELSEEPLLDEAEQNGDESQDNTDEELVEETVDADE